MKLKKFDYIIIIVLVIITLASSYAAFVTSMRKFDEVYVNIEVDGNFYKKVSLSQNNKLEIQTSLGLNTVEIIDNKVHITKADCPDKVCIKDGFISKPGQILVCLPNKVTVQIIGIDKDINELDDSTY